MGRLGWRVGVVLAVVLAFAPGLRAQGSVEEVLGAVPADSAATIVISSFTGFQQDLAMVANVVMPGQGMALPMILQQALGTPGGQGLSLQKSVGIVVLALEEGRSGGGVLLPIASYSEFVTALEQMGFTKTIEEDLDAFTVQGFAGPTTYYAAGEGAYRFWSQSKGAALAYQKKFQAQAPMLAAELPTATRALMAEADLSVYAPMAELAPRVQSLATSLAAQMQAAAAMSAADPEQAARMEMAQKVVLVELDALGAVLAQIDWALVALDITEEGVRVRAHLAARPETKAAEFFRAQAGGESALLRQLPSESWLALSGRVDLGPVRPALKELVKQIVEAVGATDPETTEELNRALEAMDIYTGEMAFAMLSGGEQGGLLNLVELFKVTDPARALETMKDWVLMWQDSPLGSAMGGGVVDFAQAEVTSPLETYRGVEISQVSMPISAPAEMPPEAARVITQMYGERMVYQYGVLDDTLILALGVRANELIKKTIDGLKDGTTGLAQSPGYLSAVSGLPKTRSITGYFSLIKMAQAFVGVFTASMGATMAEQGMPLPTIDLESVEGVTPSGVGLALSFKGEQATYDIFLPRAELANVGALIQQVLQSMAPPGGPGQPGPVPPPMP